MKYKIRDEAVHPFCDFKIFFNIMNILKFSTHNTFKGEVMKNKKKSKVANKSNDSANTKNCK